MIREYSLSLVIAFLGWLQKTIHELRFASFLFSQIDHLSLRLDSQFDKNKKSRHCRDFMIVFWRRVRDSNPRTCYSQQFSRLPQSTTLPTLRAKDNTIRPLKKNGFSFLSQNFYISAKNFLLTFSWHVHFQYPYIAVLKDINISTFLIPMPFLLGIFTVENPLAISAED